MSLVNAVHVLLEVAAGRRNLSPADADQLHDEIDTPAAVVEHVVSPPQPDPQPEPAEGVNLDAPADT